MFKIKPRKRKSFYLFVAGCLLVQMLSCTKFLQVQPRDYMFGEEVFSSRKGVESALNGIYESLADPQLYGNMLTMNATEVLGQYYYTGYGMSFALNRYSYTDNSAISLFSEIWMQAYQSILEVNEFCSQLNNPSFHVLESDARNIFLGESIAIRAFLHFDQLRLFGPIYSVAPDMVSIPYVRKAKAEIQPLLSANKVIAEILHDLDSALILLEKDPVRSKGVNKAMLPGIGESIDFLSNRNRRMNYFAVKTLQARVLLYAGKKTEAWEAVQSIILAQEAFFPWQTEQQMAGDPVLSGESYFGIENKALYNNYRQFFSPMLADDQIYAPTPLRLDRIYNPSSNDLRLKYWFKVGLEGDKSYKVFVKYSDLTITDKAIRYYQPLIRKSELYLIAAETSPDLQLGYFYLNNLRVNKGLPPVNFELTSTRSDLLSAVRDEYQREFIGEGQTFFMFKRLNLAIPSARGLESINMTEQYYVVPLPEKEIYYR